MKRHPEVSAFLKTLRRIPDSVVQRMATREFIMTSNRSCVCGWAIREVLANGLSAEKVLVPHMIDGVAVYEMADEACAVKFGGAKDEWESIFSGVLPSDDETYLYRRNPKKGKLPFIEEAFAIRVAECT